MWSIARRKYSSGSRGIAHRLPLCKSQVYSSTLAPSNWLVSHRILHATVQRTFTSSVAPLTPSSAAAIPSTPPPSSSSTSSPSPSASSSAGGRVAFSRRRNNNEEIREHDSIMRSNERSNRPERNIEYFERHVPANDKNDSFLFGMYLNALAEKRPNMVLSVFDEYCASNRADVHLMNIMLDFYSRTGEIEKAEKLFQRMKNEAIRPNRKTYYFMGQAYAFHNNVEKFNEMATLFLAARAESNPSFRFLSGFFTKLADMAEEHSHLIDQCQAIVDDIQRLELIVPPWMTSRLRALREGRPAYFKPPPASAGTAPTPSFSGSDSQDTHERMESPATKEDRRIKESAQVIVQFQRSLERNQADLEVVERTLKVLEKRSDASGVIDVWRLIEKAKPASIPSISVPTSTAPPYDRSDLPLALPATAKQWKLLPDAKIYNLVIQGICCQTWIRGDRADMAFNLFLRAVELGYPIEFPTYNKLSSALVIWGPPDESGLTTVFTHYELAAAHYRDQLQAQQRGESNKVDSLPYLHLSPDAVGDIMYALHRSKYPDRQERVAHALAILEKHNLVKNARINSTLVLLALDLGQVEVAEAIYEDMKIAAANSSHLHRESQYLSKTAYMALISTYANTPIGFGFEAYEKLEAILLEISSMGRWETSLTPPMVEAYIEMSCRVHVRYMDLLAGGAETQSHLPNRDPDTYLHNVLNAFLKSQYEYFYVFSKITYMHVFYAIMTVRKNQQRIRAREKALAATMEGDADSIGAQIASQRTQMDAEAMNFDMMLLLKNLFTILRRKNHSPLPVMYLSAFRVGIEEAKTSEDVSDIIHLLDNFCDRTAASTFINQAYMAPGGAVAKIFKQFNEENKIAERRFPSMTHPICTGLQRSLSPAEFSRTLFPKVVEQKHHSDASTIAEMEANNAKAKRNQNQNQNNKQQGGDSPSQTFRWSSLYFGNKLEGLDFMLFDVPATAETSAAATSNSSSSSTTTTPRAPPTTSVTRSLSSRVIVATALQIVIRALLQRVSKPTVSNSVQPPFKDILVKVIALGERYKLFRDINDITFLQLLGIISGSHFEHFISRFVKEQLASSVQMLQAQQMQQQQQQQQQLSSRPTSVSPLINENDDIEQSFFQVLLLLAQRNMVAHFEEILTEVERNIPTWKKHPTVFHAIFLMWGQQGASSRILSYFRLAEESGPVAPQTVAVMIEALDRSADLPALFETIQAPSFLPYFSSRLVSSVVIRALVRLQGSFDQAWAVFEQHWKTNYEPTNANDVAFVAELIKCALLFGDEYHASQLLQLLTPTSASTTLATAFPSSLEFAQGMSQSIAAVEEWSRVQKEYPMYEFTPLHSNDASLHTKPASLVVGAPSSAAVTESKAQELLQTNQEKIGQLALLHTVPQLMHLIAELQQQVLEPTHQPLSLTADHTDHNSPVQKQMRMAFTILVNEAVFRLVQAASPKQ